LILVEILRCASLTQDDKLTLFFVSFLYNLSQVRKRNLVRGAAEVANHFEVFAFFFQVLQVLEGECGKRSHSAFAAARAMGNRIDFFYDVDFVGAAQLVQEFIQVKAFGRVHVAELGQVLDNDFNQVNVLVFQVREGFDIETGSVVQLARVFFIEGGFDTHGRADLFRLQQVGGEVLAHRHGGSFDNAFVDALALLVQLDHAHTLGNQGRFVSAHGLEFWLRNHGADQALRRGVRLHQRDFARESGGEAYGTRELERSAQKDACDGVFGQKLEGEPLGIVFFADFVHRRSQVDDNQAEGRFFARSADNTVLEVHMGKFSKMKKNESFSVK